MKVVLLKTLEDKGRSQYWLSKQTGITLSAINNLCNEKTTRIDFSVLQKICDALDCNVEDIIQADTYVKPFTIDKSDTE